MKKITFNNSDGLKLVGLWQFPNKDTKKVIVLAHGITVDKHEGGVFDRLAEYLTANGYTVFRFDFRGSGESEGKSIDMTIDGEIDDLKSAVEYVRSLGYTEIGLLAASFGGGIASLYLPKNQEFFKAVCLWNPVLDYEHTFTNPTLPWLVEKKKKMSTDMLEQGWTTIGSRKFVIGKKLWQEFKKLEPYLEFKKISLPVLIIHAERDTYVPYDDSKEYVNFLKNGKLYTVKEGEHGFDGKENGEPEVQAETLSFFKDNF